MIVDGCFVIVVQLEAYLTFWCAVGKAQVGPSQVARGVRDATVM